jgi:hypothetical protein
MSEFKGTYNVSVLAFSLTLIFFVGSLTQRVLYNVYQHPLARIPGPKLAGATYLYQTYVSLVGGKSRYYTKFAEFHKRYGKSLTLKTTLKETLIHS